MKYPELYKRAVTTGETQRFEEYSADTERWYWLAAYPSEEDLTVFFRDITKKKHANQELRDSKNKLAAILNSTSENHILIAPDFRIMSYNKSALTNASRLLGRVIREGRSVLEFLMPKSEKLFTKNFNKALSGKKLTFEQCLSFPYGERRWYRIELLPTFDETNELIGVVLNSVDIDAIQKYELSLEKSNSKLRASAYKQSHEMRAPIARIIGLIDLFKEHPADSEVMRHIEIVAA